MAARGGARGGGVCARRRGVIDGFDAFDGVDAIDGFGNGRDSGGVVVVVVVVVVDG